MNFLVLYLYILGTSLLYVMNEDDWKFMNLFEKFTLITWPLIPLWLIVGYISEKYHNWKWKKEQEKWEKEHPPENVEDTP